MNSAKIGERTDITVRLGWNVVKSLILYDKFMGIMPERDQVANG